MPRGVTKAARANIQRHNRATLNAAKTNDSFQNFAARVGVGTDNLASASTYGFNPISRLRTLLEWMYRGSWIVGQAVDTVAEDMTKMGVEYRGEQNPDDTAKLQAALVRHQIWLRLQETVKWARLYGGCLAVIMIDGHKPDTDLRLETIGRGQFKGLMVMDRWMVEPSLNDLVTDLKSPDLGLPRYYNVSAEAPALPRMRIHHSRCIRLVGVELPYWQKIAENLWGMSVIERIYDRLIAFDSGTQGAAQLLYRAYLRTLKIPDLRTIVSTGGPALEGLVAQLNFMRGMQSNEGMSVIDATDDFETSTYTFAGISDTLLQMGQQLSGALQIPLVRLFGQSPSGMNSTGESDLRTYYDGINQRQETMLRRPMDMVSRVIAQSEGIKLDPTFDFIFNPLWQIDDVQRADVASKNTATILDAEASGLVDNVTALKELKQQSGLTGMWTNITDEMIAQAQYAPAPGVDEALDGVLGTGAAPGAPPGGPAPPPGSPGVKPPGQSAKKKDVHVHVHDALPLTEVHGLPILIEHAAGERRMGPGWSVVMPVDYGYIRRTSSAEGKDEAMDCFLGLDRQSRDVWVIDQLNPETGKFDEHKCMLGFLNSREALAAYGAAFSGGAVGRIQGVTHMDIDSFKRWVTDPAGDFTKALSTRTADLRAEPKLRAS